MQEAVDRKYKISFHKGVQIVFEQLILLILMISMILKANIFSIVYLLFVFRYVQCSVKIHLLARLVTYMSVCFILQYVLYLFNLTA